MRTRSASAYRSVRDNESVTTTSSSYPHRRIILMAVDMYESDVDSYIMALTGAMNDMGHHLTIVRNRGVSTRSTRHINISFFQTGTWIPRTIWGYFRSTMYMLRSAYTAMWVVVNLRTSRTEVERTLVVSDASCVVVPMLQQLGNFQVVCTQYFRELLAEFQPFREPNSITEWLMGPIRRRFLSAAEMILVPCQNSRELVDTFEDDERVAVLYPPAEGENSVRYEMAHGAPIGRLLYRRYDLPHPLEYEVRHTYNFVAVGMYEPHANFHVLIDAFDELMNGLNHVQQQRLRLDIVGSWETARQRAYRRELHAQVANCGSAVAARVTLHSNLSFEHRCALYRASCAVFNANASARYVPSLIEAFYFGRLVVTVNSDFSSEIMRHTVTGLVVPVDVESIAQSMLNVVYQGGPAYRLIAMAATYEYDDVYSFPAFTNRLRHFILSLTDNDISNDL